MNIKKIYITFFVTYCILAFSSFFLIGEQIKYKQSKKNESMPEATRISEELSEDVVFEQDFVNELDKLETLSIVFHNYWRSDLEGSVFVELYLGRERIIFQEIEASFIKDQHRTFISLGGSLDGLKDQTITLKVYSNSPEEKGVALMLSDSSTGQLYKNGDLVEGRICFETTGKQKIVLGDYYWPIMGAVGLVLGAILFISYKKYKKGRNDLIVASLFALSKYNFLISQLVSRDFKSKYKRSILGIVWSFLNPLLTMIVQFLVFSTLFKSDSNYYPVYLLSGVICFNFFNEATTMCLGSIVDNANLIDKVYIPRYIFPFTKIISSTINLGIALVPLFLVCIVLGVPFSKSIILMFFFLVCLIIFTLGVGLFLSALMVFFRDIRFLWTVVCQIWMYATPIFYSAEIIPDKYSFIVKINPLYHFIGNLRKCLMDGVSPEPITYAFCLFLAALSFMIGSYVFKKTQDKFTIYL